MKITIQTGLGELERQLGTMGYELIPYRGGSAQTKVCIINNVDEAYEEIDPVTFMGTGENEVVLLDASRLSSEDVLKFVSKYAPL